MTSRLGADPLASRGSGVACRPLPSDLIERAGGDVAEGFGQSQERAERLLTLAWILEGRRPIPLTELREHYGLYAEGDPAASRRKFERDKRDLRELGLDIETVSVDDTEGYRLRRGTSATTRVTWNDEELDTLAVLAATVGDAATGTALAQLAAPSGEFPAEHATASVHVELDVPDAVTAAIASERRLAFRYRDADGVVSDRVIEPWEPRRRGGLTYLTGYDVDRGGERNFRLDRIVGELEILDQASTHPPPDGGLAPLHPVEQLDVVVDVPVDRIRDVERIDGQVVDERDDGRLRVRFAARRGAAMLGWSLRHGAVIREPERLAADQRRSLDRLVDLHTGHPTPVERPATPRNRSGPLTQDRLKRMLTLPSWLGERAGVTLEETARAFGCTVAEIETELELLELIDIPGVGSVVETELHDDGQIVYHRFAQEPSVDLSPTDALRLLLLVRTGGAVLSDEEAPALAAIEQRLRELVPATVDVELPGADHVDLQRLRTAIRDDRAVRFDYRGRRDSGWRERHVAPERTIVANGAVYLVGHDLEAGGQRNFRLDRLSGVEVLDEQVEVAAEAAPPTYVPSARETELVLRLTTRATWILTHVTPDGTGPTEDGGAIAVVRTDAVDWAVSHVMAAGGEAEVVFPTTVRNQVRDRAEELRGASTEPVDGA